MSIALSTIIVTSSESTGFRWRELMLRVEVTDPILLGRELNEPLLSHNCDQLVAVDMVLDCLRVRISFHKIRPPPTTVASTGPTYPARKKPRGDAF